VAPLEDLIGPAAFLGATDGRTGWLATSWPWIAAAVVAALLVVAFVFFARYLRISLRLFLNTQMPMTAEPENGRDLEGDLHEFPSRDGTSLMGAFLDPPPAVPVRGTVIFAHEFKGDRHSAARYTRSLRELGLRVFAFDFRGHGGSSADAAYQPTHWATDHEVDDLLGAVAYVEATAGRTGHPVGIMGVSRGACAAVIAALQAPAIRALVLDGVFSTDMMVEGLMKRWAHIFAAISLVRPTHPPEAFGILRVFTILYAELKLRCRFPLVRKALPRLADVPALFIYGKDDAYIDPQHRVKLYRAKRGTKHLWEVSGAKHNQAVVADPDGYRREVAAFFDQHMPAADPREDARGD
jgi:pimeloyl-ACP methyl ester carboxylesterase